MSLVKNDVATGSPGWMVNRSEVAHHREGDLLMVEGRSDGLAEELVAAERPLAVEDRAPLLEAAYDLHGHVGIGVKDRPGRRRDSLRHDVDLTGTQCRYARRDVLDDPELDGVDERFLRAGATVTRLAAGGVVRERTRRTYSSGTMVSNMKGPVPTYVVSSFGAAPRAMSAGMITRACEDCVRSKSMLPRGLSETQAEGVVAEALEDHIVPLSGDLAGYAPTVVRGLDVVDRHLLSVVEGDALAELEGPGAAGVVDLVALSETELRAPVHVEVEELLVDVARGEGHLERRVGHLVEVRGRRVERHDERHRLGRTPRQRRGRLPRRPGPGTYGSCESSALLLVW